MTATKINELISYDPATGEELGHVPLCSAAEVTQAVSRARRAQVAWAAASFAERGRIVLRARAILLAEMDELAALIARESGKPVAEAIAMEIVPTLDLMRHFARHTHRLLKPERINIGQYGLMGRRSKIIYRPLGVVGIISPWNFPWAIPLGEVVMALMAGNAVVLKPSELTPLVGLKIGELFTRAGLPKDTLIIMTGDGATGAALVEAGTDKLMFTGSVETGKRVAAAAAKTLTPVVLELGGKDPFIVLADADVETAAHAAVWGAFANAGQACASVERCYVHESVAAQFVARVTEITGRLAQRADSEAGADVGAMSSERQLEIVTRHVREAIAGNAQVAIGGARVQKAAGHFYPPTVLTNVNQEMTVMREETFGPVLPIMVFNTEEEAIRLANDSIYGLTASVWTRDVRRGEQIAERIEAGTVMVNEVLYTHGIAQTPWGGVKQSGLGRTHGRLGLLELVSPRHIHINRFGNVRDLWWFKYTPAATNMFRGLARRFSTGSSLQTSLLVPQIIKRFFETRNDER